MPIPESEFAAQLASAAQLAAADRDPQPGRVAPDPIGVEQALDILRVHLERTHAQLEKLEHRLGPILAAEPPAAPEAVRPPEGACIVADALTSLAWSLEQAADRLAVVAHRVAL